MRGLRRKTAGITAAALMLAACTMLAFPASASAETKTVPCGSEVTAKPGDRILATDPLLGVVPLDLGVVTESTTVLTGTMNALLGTVCKVTVKVVDTAVRPIPGVGEPAADALTQGASKLNETTQDTVDTLDSALNPSDQQPRQPQPEPANPPDNRNQPSNDAPKQGGSPETTAPGIPPPDSRAFGSGVPLSPAFLPLQFSSGWAPMRDYSGIPIASPGLYAPSPGIRYGSQIPGYTPEFDVLGSNGSTGDAGDKRVSKAGEAKALPGAGPGPGGNPASLPVLLAVIALAASTAALVRTWVLRKA